jgi:hypothetical protein
VNLERCAKTSDFAPDLRRIATALVQLVGDVLTPIDHLAQHLVSSLQLAQDGLWIVNHDEQRTSCAGARIE